MKDSYSATPLKLWNLNEEVVKNPPKRFYPLFGDEEKEMGTKSEANDTKEWEEKLRNVFEEAYAEGEKAGYEMGMRKVEPIIKRFNTYIESLEAFMEEMKKRAEKLALELSLIIAEAIILKECSIDKSVVLCMVKKALDLCDKKSEIVIRVRREDVQYVSEGLPSIKVIPEDVIQEPGFVIESNFGDIDGTIKTQLEEIKKEIMNYVE